MGVKVTEADFQGSEARLTRFLVDGESDTSGG